MIGSISSQFSGENSFNEIGKTNSKPTKKSCRKQRVWKSKTQRKTLGKTLDRIENKYQNNSQRFFFTNDFPTLLKTNRNESFLALKYFWKLAEDVNFSSKNSYPKL